MLILSATLAILMVFFSIEYILHSRRVNSIPLRIHVNGTRGKSSVTRLIAAALREHGKRTFAKTTGTLPRMIMDDGSEYPVYRPSSPNIIEQLRIIALAHREKAEAIVIECMAIQPMLQAISEMKMIKSTIGVITNVRPDHLEIMGPDPHDVAQALSGTIPVKGVLFTAEQNHLSVFKDSCTDRKSELFALAKEDLQKITDEEMNGFSYIEHRENIALVLKICDYLKIPRTVALRGMWKASPDPGVLSSHLMEFFGKKIFFFNAFAANDPESSEKIWKMIIQKFSDINNRIMLINCRDDRMERSLQLGEAIVNWQPADRYVVMGGGSYILMKRAISKGLNPSAFIYAEGMSVDQVFEEIINLIKTDAVVVGIGNIGGKGLEIVRYFNNRSTDYRISLN
jgi:poly-gamma-glutamate synthase PgsB/CapB